MSKENVQNKHQVVGIVGVGLDSDDEHKRITRNEDVLIVGGSEDTHEHLQEVSIRFNESLQGRGKRLADAEVHEVIDLLHKATEE